MSGSVVGHTGVERITVTATLVRVDPGGVTTHIATWANLTGTGMLWSWERTHHVARGHYYRLVLTATAVRNGISETVTQSSHTVRAH